MRGHEWIMFRISIALEILAALLFLGAVIALKKHNVDLSLILFLAAAILFIPGYIVGKVSDKLFKKKIETLNQTIENIRIIPTKEENYPWLSRNKLESWTNELASKGFDNLGDYTVSRGEIESDDSPQHESFTRIMVNEDIHCFAEISQSSKPMTGIGDITCGIVTFYTSGYRFQTSNSNKPFCLPIKLICSNIPEASPSELIQLHMEQRNKFTAEQGLKIAEETTFEYYQQQAAKALQDMREFINLKDREMSDSL